MIIHVVTEGETLTQISQKYDISISQLIRQNEITNPDNLIPGQDIIIEYTAITYTVEPGDTLLSIAELYHVTVIELLQNNPNLILNTTLYEGQTIVIEYNDEKIGRMTTVGYAYPYIDRDTLLLTLPYLTYLTLFTYGFNTDGTLIPIEDTELIQLARDYGVAPLMLISTLNKEGVFSNALAHELLTSEEMQDSLLQNILTNLNEKNYYGLDIDFEFVYPEDREAFAAFVNKASTLLNAEGYPVFIALVPKTSAEQVGELYEAHDYAALGAAANMVLLMTYEWGYTYEQV